ncbi:MAG: TetR/AcrR family transcriptional regulator [Caulobacteraceae bacterium]|nr:TetR/AcrR family transcriptional regulator [Caulobacteraceae bacterium]
MTDVEADRASGRPPRQARGRVRREAIIDAAAQIVAADGPEALTIHAAARRAGASIGSMYHFFQNRDALLEALMQRHHAALAEISAQSRQITLETWRKMTAEEVIGRVFGRPLDYFAGHRDALALVTLQDSARADEFQELLLQVMVARLGETIGAKSAVTLFAVCAGTLFFLRETQLGGKDSASRDIPKVLTAYLAAVERAIAGDKAS